VKGKIHRAGPAAHLLYREKMAVRQEEPRGKARWREFGPQALVRCLPSQTQDVFTGALVSADGFAEKLFWPTQKSRNSFLAARKRREQGCPRKTDERIYRYSPHASALDTPSPG